MRSRRSICVFPKVCFSITLVWLSFGVPSSTGQEKLQPYLGLPVQAGDPDVSSDGKTLAFTWRPPDQSRWGVYLVSTNGGVPDLFARDDGRGPTQKPKWSPDGHWVAFLRSGSPRGALLFVRSRINSDERFLGLVCADTETWAADSKSVIAPSSKNVDAGNECEMTAFPIRAGEKPAPLNLRGRLPALSRGGTMLAFVHEREIRLVSVTPEGRPVGVEKTVVVEPRGVSSLIWAANGSEILYVLLEDLTRLRRVEAHAAAVARDALRVDGEIASIAVTPGGHLIGGLESRINSIWAIDVAATKANPVMVRDLPWNVGASTISPDGKRLVYSVSSGGTSEVYVTSLRESEPQRLFSLVKAEIGQLSWSPDGKQIAMIGETGSGQVRPSHLIIGPANGGSPKSVLDQFDSVYQVAWLADSGALFVVAESKGTTSIWRLKLADGSLTRVLEGGALQLEVSSDNRFLYVRRFPNSLVRVPIGGGVVDPVASGVLQFALSRDSVYVERQDSKPPAAEGLNLYRIGSDAPMSHFVTSVKFLPSSVTLPRNGGLLYMERREPVKERVMVLPQLG